MGFEYVTPAITRWKLDEFVKVIDEFEEELSDKVHHKMCVKNDYNTILLHIAGKSLITTREILTLCSFGYTDGALSLGRNLYEQMIIVGFFEIHKKDKNFQDYIADFFLSYDVQRNKCLRDIEKYVPDSKIEELNEEWQNLKKKAKHAIRRDYWWTGYNNFSEVVDSVMADQTDEAIRIFLGIHYMRYKRACISLHAGCMGNTIRISGTVGFDEVDTSATLYGQSTPLMYAVTSLIPIVGNICDAFSMDGTEYVKELNSLASWYQEEEKRETKGSSQ